ncbi:hypothetical protein EPN81_01555, partial [Patescibacteria group bacterium]
MTTFSCSCILSLARAKKADNVPVRTHRCSKKEARKAMNPSRQTSKTLTIAGFTDSESVDLMDLTMIKPKDITRFAFDKDSGYTRVRISDEVGPQNDGWLEFIDAIMIDNNMMGIEDSD